MQPIALRTRSLGEILDTGFQLYRRGWVPMATATIILISPVLLVEALAPVGALGAIDRLMNIFFIAASAAVVLIASEAYRGRSMDAPTAVGRVLRRFLSVWGAAIIQGILIGIGTLLLIVPGIIAAAWTFAMQQAVMVEGAKAGEAFGRSRDLTRGHTWHVLGVIVVAFLITFVPAITMAMLFAPGVVGLGEREGLIALNLVLVLLQPIGACIATALYYDMRVRKEAFDVEVMTQELAAAEGATPAPAT